MDIVFVIFRAYPPYIGGNEIEAITTARALVSRGANVSIYSADLSGDLEPEFQFEKGIMIHRFPSFRPRNSLWFSPALFKDLLGLKEKVVHSISIHVPAWETAVASRFNKKIRFISEPIYDFIEPDYSISLKYRLIETFLGKEILHSAAWIRCLSEGEKRLIVKRTNIKASKCVVIPASLNEHWLEYAGNLRKQKNSSNKIKKILFAGRLVPHKNVHYIIKAFASLLHESSNKNIELRIVGDGPEMPFLKKISADFGIKNKVNYLGFLPDKQLYQEYAEADLFVLPSRHESFSIATLEALSMGIPSIVLDHEPFKELVAARQVVGIEFPIDTNNLAHRMWQLLAGEISLEKYSPTPNEEITKSLMDLYIKC
jgi:glycosyltransferase involved in cell wall biosynthesis